MRELSNDYIKEYSCNNWNNSGDY